MLKIRQATLNDLEILLEFEQLLIDYERNLTSILKMVILIIMISNLLLKNLMQCNCSRN